MTKLIFKSSEDFKTLADKTLNTMFFKIPYSKKTTKEKGLWLVKDEGIYLMKAFVGSEKEENPIIYAEGFDPNKNKNVWQKSYSAVGGDDFAEFLPFTIEALQMIKKGVDIDVKCTKNTIETSYLMKQ